jgi:hypothetical protein
LTGAFERRIGEAVAVAGCGGCDWVLPEIRGPFEDDAGLNKSLSAGILSP